MEAKQNARSNDLVLSSERAPKSKPNRCAVQRRPEERESGAKLARQPGREGGGGGRKLFLCCKCLLMYAFYLLTSDQKRNAKKKKKSVNKQKNLTRKTNIRQYF